MPVSCNIENNTITIKVDENITGDIARQLEITVRGCLGEAPNFVFDLGGVRSISSLGFRAMMMVLSHVKSKPRIVNAGIDVIKTFEITSFDDIFDVERSYREFSLDGCTQISTGLCGTCWRVDEETVIKLYNEGTPVEWIRREKAFAREAFIAGIPTAISFDMVKCGDCYGILFELINAKTMASTCASDLKHLSLYAHQLAQLAQNIHTTKLSRGSVPDYIELRRPFIKQMRWMTQKQRTKLEGIIDDMPRANTLVHGDFHANNVMMSKTEGPLLIDMGDLAIGSPLFDISRIFNLYVRDYSSDIAFQVTKLEKADRFKFWKSFVRYYFDNDDPIFLLKVENEVKKYACVSLLNIVNYFPETFEDNKAFMLEVIEKTPLKRRPPVKIHPSY